MSEAGMVEGVIDIDDTLTSSCNNSEIEAASHVKEIEGIKNDIEDDCAARVPVSEEQINEPQQEIGNEADVATEEIASSPPQEIKDNETMAVKTSRLQYSREELMTLMHHPMARIWPSHIDQSFQKMQGTCIKIDLDRLVKFTQENKCSGLTSEPAEFIAGPPVAIPEKIELELKKPKDPRERIKQEEQDGIVLSPQRRSFGTGCRVHHHPGSFLQNKRTAETSAEGPPPREMHREMPIRRIGSGRIVRREDMEGMGPRKDFAEVELRHRDWRMKNEGRYDKYRDDRNDKRRNFYEQERMQQHPDRRDKRRNMDSRRMGHEYVEETPEWFTGGPSSQNEFIELVGFEEAEKASRANAAQKEPNRGVPKKKISPPATPTIKEVDEPEGVEPSNDQDVMQFGIDNIILGDFFDVGSGEAYHSSGKSRLKQLFQDQSSPPHEAGSSRSSGDCNNPPMAPSAFKEPVIQVTCNDNSVANLFNQNGSLGRLSAQLNNPPSVNDLIIGGKGQALQDIEANLRNKQEQPKNIDLNRNPDQKGAFNQFLTDMNRMSKMENTANTDNIIKKLLNGGGGGTLQEEQSVPQTRQPAMPNNASTEGDLIAMLLKNGGQGRNDISGHKMPQQLQMPFNSGIPASVRHTSPTFMGPQGQHSNHLSVPQSNHEVILKMLQQQQQQQKKQQAPQLLHPGFQHQDPIKQLIGGGGTNANSQQGLLQPDVQMLLQRLASGQVTEGQLLAQLANARGITTAQREAIATVLKLLHSHQRATPSPTPVGGPITLATTPISLSPRVVSPNPDVANMLSAPSHHILPPQRVSPLMFNAAMGGNARRPPSHQELVAHTQSILQKALIKQELEKAKEKHRKREHERIKSPNPSANVLTSMGDSRNTGKSQSPLAFTPTSVMRKMTEKDKHSLQEMNRHPNQTAANYYQNNAQIVPGNVLNMEAKKDMSNKNFLGPKANVSMCSSNATPSGHMMPPNRHILPQQHSSISRHSQNHQQMALRGQGANMHGQQLFGNACQGRMQGPPPGSLQHLFASKNNNGYPGIKSDNVPMGQIGGPPNPAVNLANLFGRDIVAQAQNGKLPDLPGGQALSLEEVEKLQQNQANKVLSCYKYVR